MKFKSIVPVLLIAVAAVFCFGFSFNPRPQPNEVDVTTRIEMIGNHQYAIAISTTRYGYDAKSSIAMVHHEGCSTCASKRSQAKLPRPRPPVALPYPGQF